MNPNPASEAQRIQQLRAAVVTQLEHGVTLDTIEGQLIAPSQLPEEQQSAMWLYAWSHPIRRPATDELAGVKPGLASTVRRYAKWQLPWPDHGSLGRLAKR